MSKGDDRDELVRAMQEIWRICHVPTKDTPFRAYTHFQHDFDRIRALTKPFVEG